MKPLFKNTTQYTKQNYEQFVEFHNKKYNFSYNIYTLVMAILLIYCLAFNITQKNITFALLFLVLLVIFLLLRLYVPAHRYKKTQNNYNKNKEENFTFLFYKYYFTINKKTFYYFKLFKVFETKEYFYLYINEETAALISKNGFTIGNPNDFSNFIKKQCLFRYKNQT